MVIVCVYFCGVMDRLWVCFLVVGGFNNKELNLVEIFDVKIERWFKVFVMLIVCIKSGGVIVGDYFVVVSFWFIFFDIKV